MTFSRRTQILLGVFVIAGLVWWFYLREPLPLGYIGTGPNPHNFPGVRPTVECPINTDLITGVELSLDGKPLKSTEVTLPRNKKLMIHGKLDLGNVPSLANLLVVQISVASQSKNAQGMLIEGETMLYAGNPVHPTTEKGPPIWSSTRSGWCPIMRGNSI